MFPLTRSRGHLWAHSSEPLRQPLLKRVHTDAELRDAACQIFIDILPQPACPSSMPTPPPLAGPGRAEHRAEWQHTAQGAGQGWRGARVSQWGQTASCTCSLTATPILRYMGDYPSRQAWASVELTDQIFSLALQDTALQDEVYCQILKQLTHNSKRSAGAGRAWRAPAHTGHRATAPQPSPSPRGSGHSAELEGPLLDATQPTWALEVALGWAGTLVCPADILGCSEQGGRWTCLGPCLLPTFSPV